jgi:hypothetical protein
VTSSQSRMLRVLVACECSGAVRRELRARGHNAWSCDLLPAEDGSRFHFQTDCRNIIPDLPWDMMIAFPPCTHLSGSGARWCVDHWVTKKNHPDGRYWHDGTEKRRQRAEAVEFVKTLWAAPIPMVAIENPVGRLSTLWMKPTQIIQPWQHGHGEVKGTCLWLRNLPKIVPTNIVEGREQVVWKMTPSDTRARDRSLTYSGIARAMATQWTPDVVRQEQAA